MLCGVFLVTIKKGKSKRQKYGVHDLTQAESTNGVWMDLGKRIKLFLTHILSCSAISMSWLERPVFVIKVC